MVGTIRKTSYYRLGILSCLHCRWLHSWQYEDLYRTQYQQCWWHPRSKIFKHITDAGWEEFSIYCNWKWIKPSNAEGMNIHNDYEYKIINVYSVLPFGIPKIWCFGFIYQMYNDPIHRQIINRMNKNKEFSWKKDYFSSFQELLKVRIEINWLLNGMR